MKRPIFAETVPARAVLFLMLTAALFAVPAKPLSASEFQPEGLPENQMKIGSTTGAPGDLVSVPVSIRNTVPVGLLYMRISYAMNFGQYFVAFRAFRPAPRTVIWEYFDSDSDTFPGPGQIHISGVTDPNYPMQPDSTPVCYLDFEIIDQPVPPNVIIPICFEFRDSIDNTMYDSTGDWIDSSEIDYVCGSITILPTGVQNPKGGRPRGFELGQNYPNPFNSSTSFTLTLSKSGPYTVQIYNLAGQRVKSFEGEAPAGRKTLSWDGTDQNGAPVSSGIYFYKAVAGGFSSTKKMILVK
ncbi:MAG: T9SS type A sorting domain-containing protein [candidate division Zixibacteria bacterium]|nr:T9SS type A sorting domain-containing protein [candidate division Zixibacteria bacterium]